MQWAPRSRGGLKETGATAPPDPICQHETARVWSRMLPVGLYAEGNCSSSRTTERLPLSCPRVAGSVGGMVLRWGARLCMRACTCTPDWAVGGIMIACARLPPVFPVAGSQHPQRIRVRTDFPRALCERRENRAWAQCECVSGNACVRITGTVLRNRRHPRPPRSDVRPSSFGAEVKCDAAIRQTHPPM